MARPQILKADTLGTISIVVEDGVATVVRDSRVASGWARRIARMLAAREAAALRALAGVEGVPALIRSHGGVVQRSYIAGEPLHVARPRTRGYFAQALKLVVAIHRRGVVHNDLAKEANWLCTPGGRPAIVDFQVAISTRRRGKLFRSLAREDLRHLMKHKRTYLPEALTARQRSLLQHPSVLARAWRALVKPPYMWITRSGLGWPERRGPAERERART
jgi:RIO-like serine/threonine protein kinase